MQMPFTNEKEFVMERFMCTFLYHHHHHHLPVEEDELTRHEAYAGLMKNTRFVEKLKGIGHI